MGFPHAPNSSRSDAAIRKCLLSEHDADLKGKVRGRPNTLCESKAGLKMAQPMSASARSETETQWRIAIEAAQALLRRGQKARAQAQARVAARLAQALHDPQVLRQTAGVFDSFAKTDTAAKLIAAAERLEAARAAKKPAGEPAALFEALHIEPGLAARTVFRYLAPEGGAHRLRAVKNKALIACTSRSGSTLLAASLERYWVNPQEFFNPEEQVKRAALAGEARTLREYANLLAQSAVSGGWFVTKGAIESFLFLCYLGEFPERSRDWKVIFLRRRNAIRQAVSMEIVARTQAWNVRQKPKSRVKPAEYSFDALSKRLEYILSANDKWERVFALLGIAPHRLFFEDLVANLAGETERAARYLGIDVGKFPAARRHVPWPKPQATSLNAQWERRFRQDLAKRMSARRPLQYLEKK